jgi:hypothetical protein
VSPPVTTELGRDSGEPETIHEGDVVIDSPLGDGGVAARAADDGAANEAKHSGQGMLATVTRPRIRDLGEEGQQIMRRRRIHSVTLYQRHFLRFDSLLYPPNQSCQRP